MSQMAKFDRGLLQRGLDLLVEMCGTECLELDDLGLELHPLQNIGVAGDQRLGLGSGEHNFVDVLDDPDRNRAAQDGLEAACLSLDWNTYPSKLRAVRYTKMRMPLQSRSPPLRSRVQARRARCFAELRDHRAGRDPLAATEHPGGEGLLAASGH